MADELYCISCPLCIHMKNMGNNKKKKKMNKQYIVCEISFELPFRGKLKNIPGFIFL